MIGAPRNYRPNHSPLSHCPFARAQSKSKSKKNKDDGRPKRASTAFMLWLNDTREQIKKDNPGIKVTEIAKKGGEMWRELKDKSIWEEKASKDKERYANEMKSYKPSGEAATSGKKRKKDNASPKKASTAASMGGGGFKSKEYISDEDSSESDGDKKKRKKVCDCLLWPLSIVIAARNGIKCIANGFFVAQKAESEEEDDEDEESDAGSGSGSD